MGLDIDWGLLDFVSKKYKLRPYEKLCVRRNRTRIGKDVSFSVWLVRITDEGRNYLEYINVFTNPPRPITADDVEHALILASARYGLEIDRDMVG